MNIFVKKGKSIEKAIEDAFSKENMDRLAKLLAEQIRKRTRLGKGINSDGEDAKQVPLRKLSPKYIEKREVYSTALSSETEASRSNLTATGQMLDSIKGMGKYAQAIIYIDKKRNRELDGSRSQHNNVEIKDFVEKSGRMFFGLTKADRNRIMRETRKQILSKLKNI